MKKKVIFHLSGTWDKSIAIAPSDKVYVAPGIDKNRAYEKATLIELYSNEFESTLCDQFFSNYSGFESRDSTGLVFAFLNDYYSYSLRPYCSLLLSVLDLAKKHNSHEVIVVSAKTDCKILPMFGFRTSESLRGSQDLIGALVAEKLKSLPEMNEADFRLVKGDLLSKNFFRVSLLRAANFLFSVNFFIKVLRLGSGSDGASYSKTIVVCRNKHQSRFAKNIILENDNMSLFLVPQLTQGSIRQLKEIRKTMPDYKGYLGLSFCEILKAYKESKEIIRKIKSDIEKGPVDDGFAVKVNGVSLPMDFSWVAKEISFVSIAVFYKAVLDKIYKKYRPKIIVNFELVGRMAGIEALSAKENKASIRTVQTALVSSRPHPVFPYSDYFFADSEATSLLIKDVGAKAEGIVGYAGPSYRIKPIKESRKVSRIVFYTQPYEFSITLAIVDLLAQWAKLNEANVVIKLHPRDERQRYSHLFKKYPDVLSLSHSIELKELFESSDLSVTRTSSVAKESMANGCPTMLCLWSDFDNRIKADYVNADLLKEYCSFRENDLFLRLDNFEKIVSSNRLVHAGVFGGKSIQDLVVALNDVGS